MGCVGGLWDTLVVCDDHIPLNPVNVLQLAQDGRLMFSYVHVVLCRTSILNNQSGNAIYPQCST